MSKKISEKWYEEIILTFQEKLNSFGMTNQDCADRLNKKFKCNFDESAWRKKYYGLMEGYEIRKKETDDNSLTKEEAERHFRRIANGNKKVIMDRKINSLISSDIHATLRKDAKVSLVQDYLIDFAEYEYDKIKVSKYLSKKSADEIKEVPMYSTADIHYGFLIDTEECEYSPEIAKRRIFDFADYIVRDVKKNKYSEFIIADFGDLIEGAGNLRNSQMLTTLMTIVEQSMGITDILTNFFVYLNQKLNNLKFKTKATVYMISASNHSQLRTGGSKRGEIDNDDVSILICDSIYRTIKSLGESIYTTRKEESIERDSKKITMEDLNLNFTYADEYIIDILGSNVYIGHGDKFNFGTDIHDRLAKLKNVIIDYALVGHWHSFTVGTVGSRGYITKSKITMPCVCGDTPHGHKYGYSSNPGNLKLTFSEKYGITNTKFIPAE